LERPPLPRGLHEPRLAQEKEDHEAQGLRAKQSKAASVFLNVPYDLRFQPLYLAYIVGVTAFGLVPRATLEIPGGTRRLERIFSLIKSCQYSIHDLSRSN
jgi:hypothetical protein